MSRRQPSSQRARLWCVSPLWTDFLAIFEFLVAGEIVPKCMYVTCTWREQFWEWLQQDGRTDGRTRRAISPPRLEPLPRGLSPLNYARGEKNGSSSPPRKRQLPPPSGSSSTCTKLSLLPTTGLDLDHAACRLLPPRPTSPVCDSAGLKLSQAQAAEASVRRARSRIRPLTGLNSVPKVQPHGDTRSDGTYFKANPPIN